MPRLPVYGPGNNAGKRKFLSEQKKAARAVVALAKATAAPKKYRASGKLQTAVKAVLERSEETKYVAEQVHHNLVVGQAATTPGGLLRLLPSLTQGTGDHQRIGDQISPSLLKLILSFRFTPENSNNQDAMVNCWILRVKGAGSAATVAASPPTALLKVGDGTNRDPNDPDQPLMLTQINNMPLNTDQYKKVKHYQFVMRRGTGAQANQGPATIIAPTGVPQKEDFRQFAVSIKPPKLKYNFSADNQPTNYHPVVIWWATNRDGSAYGDTIRASVRSHLYYKDA